MLELHYGVASEKIIVTLNELITLDAPNYLIRFTHAVTKDVVSVIRSSAADESLSPERYNQFDINTAVAFLNKQPGEWTYEIYEQESAVNTDPALATSLIEYGKMILYPATAFEYTKYDTATTFKVYNG